MSYQVIARKYRPQRFEDVVGQEHVTQTLGNAIKQNRIAHAYLFVGPRGTGKTTIARIFAKCLNCTDGPKTDYSDTDPRVLEITEGRSLDVLEIDGASNRGIDEVRELRDTVKYAPSASRFKIYIIDEVHMLTKEAFNALLKTLEEPPPHAKFMFATTEPDKVLPTILSRCQRFDLRRIPTALIVKQLAAIAVKEGAQIAPAALNAIARGADGGMRDAESTLDQLISFCGKEVSEADVLSMFGLAAEGQIFALTDAILAAQVEPALRQLNDLAKQGKDLGRIVTELLNHFRNLLIHKISKGDLSLIEASEAEAAVLARQAPQITADALTRIMEILTDCEGRLRDTTSKMILVEVTLLKVIEARNAVSIDTVLKQLQQLRAEGGKTSPVSATPASALPVVASVAPVVPPAPAAAPIPAAMPNAQVELTPVAEPVKAVPVIPVVSPPAVESHPVKTVEHPKPAHSPAPVADLGKLWTELVERVGRASPFAGSNLHEAHPVSLENSLLTIGFDPEFEDHISLVDNTKNQTIFRTKLAELGHPEVHVKFIKHESPNRANLGSTEPSATQKPRMTAKKVEAVPVATPASQTPKTTTPPPPEPVAFNQEEFKNDPLIKKALEIFKGQIVDVRS